MTLFRDTSPGSLMAWGTLAATLVSGASTLTLNPGQGARYPTAGNFVLRIESEFLICTGSSGLDKLAVARGQFGTMAGMHGIGATVPGPTYRVR